MIVADLRSKIEQVFADDVTNYETPGGNSIPAINVGRVPENYRVQPGLEIVILAAPDFDTEKFYEATEAIYDFTILLTHDQEHMLQPIVAKFLRNFPGSDVDSVVKDTTRDRYQAVIIKQFRETLGH